MSYYGCPYCGSESCESCDASCADASYERQGYERWLEKAFWHDPWNVFRELSNEFMQDRMTKEKFIEESHCLPGIDNFEIIKVIQDKKEKKK